MLFLFFGVVSPFSKIKLSLCSVPTSFGCQQWARRQWWVFLICMLVIFALYSLQRFVSPRLVVVLFGCAQQVSKFFLLCTCVLILCGQFCCRNRSPLSCCMVSLIFVSLNTFFVSSRSRCRRTASSRRGKWDVSKQQESAEGGEAPKPAAPAKR